MASTSKFVNVLPPISGSLTSAPSIANTASTPRCPLMANCWVKFVCPFTSVIVPGQLHSHGVWLLCDALDHKPPIRSCDRRLLFPHCGYCHFRTWDSLSGGRANDTGPSRRRSLLCVEWNRDRYQATKNKPLDEAEHLVKRQS